jgi:hypothetical protein
MRLLPFILALSCCAPPPLAAWGHKGHEIVAALAFGDLPGELAPWFQGRRATLVDHCNDPDHWKRADPREGPRHFLNTDAYGGPDGVPVAIQEARTRLGPAAFDQEGQVPWVIQDRVQDLARAFGSGDPARVALASAILCHYVGDVNVPLHTAANYNGQQSGQFGVHGRWETGLVDRLGAWEPEARPASPAPQPLEAPWAWMKEANDLVAPLLQDDLEAERPSLRNPRNDEPTSGYWTEFGRRQGPVVRMQLERAGQRTAQAIVMAWCLAGKPAPS